MTNQLTGANEYTAVEDPIWEKIKTAILMATDACHAERAVELAVGLSSSSERIVGLLTLRKQRMHSLHNALKDLAATGAGLETS